MSRLRSQSLVAGLILMLLFLLQHCMALAVAIFWQRFLPARTAPVAPIDPCHPLNACLNPAGCPHMSEVSPELFDVKLETSVGHFTVRVNSSWAPPFATRLWRLSQLHYMEGASFYRVDRLSKDDGWVVQFGYRGDPKVDQCWDQLQTSNQTWSVQPPGNVRGTVGFSMDAVNNTGVNPNCSAPDYCAQGFSTNIYINYGDNRHLDMHGFVVVGHVVGDGMDTVDRLYAGYGEVADLCMAPGLNRAYDRFCKGYGEACEGINMSRLLAEGDKYLRREKPMLSYIQHVDVLPTFSRRIEIV